MLDEKENGIVIEEMKMNINLLNSTYDEQNVLLSIPFINNSSRLL